MDSAIRKTVEELGHCTPETSALFTTETPEAEAKAKVICRSCPVRAMCLEEFWFEAGVVVGGLTHKQRKRMTLDRDLTETPAQRLVDSYAQGGIRGLMIHANMAEDEAVRIVRLLGLADKAA